MLIEVPNKAPFLELSTACKVSNTVGKVRRYYGLGDFCLRAMFVLAANLVSLGKHKDHGKSRLCHERTCVEGLLFQFLYALVDFAQVIGYGYQPRSDLPKFLNQGSLIGHRVFVVWESYNWKPFIVI
jgi:hypothetical protein